MHQSRTAATKNPVKSGLGKVADAIAERLNQVVESLVPQRQLQPIPVRVRSGRR